jgi:preprotein translocase subunit SecA
MFSIIKNFFDFNKREVERLSVIVKKINNLEDDLRSKDDIFFKKRTKTLTEKINSKEKTLDDILPEAFAIVREASRRTIKLRHHDVQILAGIALHEGKIIEQKTGEGKTLTATTALYLNALTGKGVHLVTVNDYLARRDAGWMGGIFDFLGLKTAAMISGESYIFDKDFKDDTAQDERLSHLRPITRKEAYDSDILYGINSEFGFDYLRDNMAHAPHALVQRGFNFAIVDEADSVLIDEARTPHIISAPYEQDISKYYEYAKIVKRLNSEVDFVIDEKLKTAHLTEMGVVKVEDILGVSNIYEKDFDTLFHIEASLKAQTLFHIDKEYIVRNDEVIIVDEFTGRLLEGRRFSEGLHQAIEAKEGVSIKQESKTLATVSLQNYFRMYDKLAGMTGTALTEAEEFNKIYKTDVLSIPTHRSSARLDNPDLIYKTGMGKFQAVIEDIATQYKKGRPVLVGTTSIDKNELVSKMLKAKGIPHELLNAKNHEQEARIIAQAGKKHAITVATNMAGRGVDIVLGGDVDRGAFKTEAQYEKALKDWQKEHDEVVSLGGLYVLGTERHESRRIDNQLRGRSGRQGDPGETRFYVSLEDDVMRIFGGEQISKLMTILKFPEDQPLSHNMVSKAIESAQMKVEGFNFDIRKHLVDYDDVLNRQRDIVYSLRRKILNYPETDPKAFIETVFKMIGEQVSSLSASYFALPDKNSEFENQFEEDLKVFADFSKSELSKILSQNNQILLEEFLLKKAHSKFKAQSKKVGEGNWHQIVRSLIMSTIDQFWTLHLTAIDDLRQGINLRGFAQLDPLIEYKNEAFRMFEKLLSDIQYESVRRVMKIEVSITQENDQILNSNQNFDKDTSKSLIYQPATVSSAFDKNSNTSKSKRVEAQSTVAKKQSIGRNDPCWCGSGKKYKKCHLLTNGS